jgi:uncharacterized UPF0160 family protein
MFSFFKKKPIIAVHDGRFHADDIFACATLLLVLDGKAKIVRTRDPNIIDASDYVVDVGGMHDVATNRFDHHQKGGAGVRENGVPFAAFGLVWQAYGAMLAGDRAVAERVEQVLVQPIDANDNAFETFIHIAGRPFPFLFNHIVSVYMPTWKESPLFADTQFVSLVHMAVQILKRELQHARDYVEAERALRMIYEQAEDKRILVFSTMYPWEEILQNYPDVLLVVASRDGRKWKTESTLVPGEAYKRKILFPEAWAGLRDAELERLSGVPGATFCHNGRFLCAASTKEAALSLAKLTLNQ